MKEQLYQSGLAALDSETSATTMKLSRKWVNEAFVDLSGINDQKFVETMTMMGHQVRSCATQDDTIIEFEISNNRPDCCCVIGLAREAAAAFNKPMKHHEPEVKGCDTCSVYELLDVDVPAMDLCNRYTCRMVKNVKIGSSPDWLCQRLKAHGIRPVNNIIDIVNYVMLEYGQPIHAFDYRCVANGEMVVREAEDGEVLITAGGDRLELKSGMLIIAADYRAVGLAGIVGGEEATITDDTEMIVFEAANFNGACIRQTAMAFGIRTDAVLRTENNPDPMMTVPAIQRACELVELLECGEVLDGMIDILNYVPEPKTLELDPEQINRLLESDIPEADMISYLNRLEIPVKGRSILLPSFRSDLGSIADVATEVRRLHECDKIRPVTLSRTD